MIHFSIRHRSLHVLLALAAASGCTGRINGGSSGANAGSGAQGADQGSGGVGGQGAAGTDPGAVNFTCDSKAPGMTVTPMRRLSLLQYKNTLGGLFAGVSGFDPLQIAGTTIAAFPPDSDTATGFSGMDARLSDQHAQGFYDVADQLAAAVSKDDAKLTALATACALQARATAACIDTFLDGFGMRTYRRPLTAAEHARYQALNDGTRDGREVFRSLVFLLLLAPQFLYQVELDGAALGGSQTELALAPYELASRLAFHFWQTMPDDELFAAAKDGSILTGAGYTAQVKRLFADPRTRKTVENFYVEWFKVGNVADFRHNAAFDGFVAGSPIAAPAQATEFLKAAAAEITDLTGHYTWDAGGTFKDLLMTDLSFARAPSLAAVYGVGAWDGTSEQPHLSGDERSGLLTRASFLVSGISTTHPIHRGAIVRRRILCEELPSPDPSALPPGALDPPPASASQTTRQRFEAKVVNEPCASCHAQMNPIGYVLESYDAIGRFRTAERIFDDATGKEVNSLPVNSAAAPHIAADDDTVIDNGADLSRAVADSGLTEGCFARQYFRFTYHREDTDADGCALEGVRAALAAGNLADALAAIATSPGFQTRKVE